MFKVLIKGEHILDESAHKLLIFGLFNDKQNTTQDNYV